MAQIADERATEVEVTEITVSKDELELLRSGMTIMMFHGPLDKLQRATELRNQLDSIKSDLGWETA